MIRFTIPGAPVPKARARVTEWGTYTPPKTVAYERSVAEYANAAMLNAKRKITSAYVEVEIGLVFPIPVSWSRKKKEQAAIGALIPTGKDVDNCAKAILDGMNCVVFNDDGLVAKLTVEKSYGALPRAVVAVTERATNSGVVIAA